MLVRRKILSGTAVIASCLSIGLATPASAAQPVAVGNLVNVQITNTNVLNNNDVDVDIAAQVPISVAANICGIDVAVLSADLADGEATCTSRSGNQRLTITQ